MTADDTVGARPPKPTERARCYYCKRFGRWVWHDEGGVWAVQTECLRYDDDGWEHPNSGHWYCEHDKGDR
jgi:hypothetical protein